jgi:hypothetical protein
MYVSHQSISFQQHVPSIDIEFPLQSLHNISVPSCKHVSNRFLSVVSYRPSVAEMSTDLPQTDSNKGPSLNKSTTRWGPQPQHICNVPNRYHLADGTDEKHKENSKENNANALVGSNGNGDGTNPWNGIDPSTSIDG